MLLTAGGNSQLFASETYSLDPLRYVTKLFGGAWQELVSCLRGTSHVAIQSSMT